MCYRFFRRVFREIQGWTPVDRIIMKKDSLRNLEKMEAIKKIEVLQSVIDQI
jgi:hypothetical protein